MRNILIWLLKKLNVSVILNVEMHGGIVKMLNPHIYICDNSINKCEFYLKEGLQFDVTEKDVKGDIYPSIPGKVWGIEVLRKECDIVRIYQDEDGDTIFYNSSRFKVSPKLFTTSDLLMAMGNAYASGILGKTEKEALKEHKDYVWELTKKRIDG